MAFASLSLNAQDNNDEPTTELNPLTVIESKDEAPSLSSGLRSSGPVTEIPKSISIINRDQIQAQGLKSVGDIIDYTPA
ncbi:MAG: Plug domain-containing protein [Verrucomicrobia bacterium]|nr:Plug domain-containing protein [Verrucomicrobiota bacterium]